MSAPDAWCANCGAHMARCHCGVAMRTVLNQPPTREQWDAMCRRRFPSTAAAASPAQWARKVDEYIAATQEPVPVAIPQPAVNAGPMYSYDEDGGHCLDVNVASVNAALNDARRRSDKRAIPFGIARTREGENLCIFLSSEGIELVTATSRTVVFERKEANRLGALLQQAATFRRVKE